MTNDLISRTKAIDALRYAQHRFTVADEAGGMGTVKWSEDVIYFAAAERVLSELPSAQLDTYWKEQCQSYEQTINKLIESLSTQPEIIHCKECKFYTEMRQDLNTGICSLACRHLGGDGFCSEAERRKKK